jgi:hypothetical protein
LVHGPVGGLPGRSCLSLEARTVGARTSTKAVFRCTVIHGSELTTTNGASAAEPQPNGVRPSPGAATWPVPESMEVPGASPRRTSLRPGPGALRSVAAVPRWGLRR